jgi:hypothetical protein
MVISDGQLAAVVPPRIPITGIADRCWPRTVMGVAAEARLKTITKWRRRNGCSRKAMIGAR